MGITEHREFGNFALPFADHVRPDADILPGVALPGVGDHQLPATYLSSKGRGGEKMNYLVACASDMSRLSLR